MSNASPFVLGRMGTSQREDESVEASQDYRKTQSMERGGFLNSFDSVKKNPGQIIKGEIIISRDKEKAVDKEITQSSKELFNQTFGMYTQKRVKIRINESFMKKTNAFPRQASKKQMNESRFNEFADSRNHLSSNLIENFKFKHKGINRMANS
jgi:hypothetical protein